jgi:HEAT repeat protein/predicted MFS family arabinose efflux permease
MSAAMPGLSTQKTAHALRHFTLSGVLWSIYGPNAIPQGAIFSGFALSLGVSEAQVAYLVSLAGLVGLWELVSFGATPFLIRRRLLLVVMGCLEITSASCVILLVFVQPQYRLALMAVLLGVAYLIGHTINPGYNSWLSNCLPAEVRARYLGGRMFAISITGMIYLFLASHWLDWQQKTQIAFAAVFMVGWVGGILGYMFLLVTPYPATEAPQTRGLTSSLLQTAHNRPFVVLAAYILLWTIAGSLAGTFYGVYMINYLKLSYSTIAIYTNITLALMMLGYLLAGSLSQRYGGKPITRLLIIPTAVVPALWAFSTADNHLLLLPVACFINGLCIAGLGIAASNLLYKVLPGGEGNSVYFAVWTAATCLGAAIGPLAGGLLKSALPDHFLVAGHTFSSLQFIFLLSAVAHLPAIVLTLMIHEGQTTSPGYLLSQFRGNLLGLAYNYGLYAVARRSETRAGAMLGLGRSRSPLAVDHLVRGLDHVSHEVRSGAARALGEGRFAEAVDPLVEELTDKGSDIRSEAAEALGKIGAGQQHLFTALYDEDSRVRASAAMALGELGTPEAREALLEALLGEFDRYTFPSLVEAASHQDDVRIIAPALDGLRRLEAPVVRLQVINGICRVLGERNHFYRLATADDLAQGRMREKMMARIRRLLSRARPGEAEQRQHLRQWGEALEAALEEDDLDTFARVARQVATLVEQLDTTSIAHQAAYALRRYLQERTASAPPDELIVFAIIALTALARALAETR